MRTKELNRPQLNVGRISAGHAPVLVPKQSLLSPLDAIPPKGLAPIPEECLAALTDL